MQLTEEANVSSPRASRGASPAPSYDGADMQEEEGLVNLMIILKVLRGVENEMKEFLKDMKLQLQDIRGEVAKTNTRLNEVEARVAGHEDKL